MCSIEACFYRLSTKALITDKNGKFLLSREENGYWDLPGGGLDHGEEPLDGLLREIAEETGLTAKIVQEQPVCLITALNNRGTYLANVLYEVRLDSLVIHKSEECQEVQFFTIEEAKLLPSWANVQAFIVWLESSKDHTACLYA